MKTVHEIMFSSPKFCGKHEPLQKAINEMSKSNIGSVPVVDADNKVVGILTDRDVCVFLGKIKKNLADIKVSEVMTHDPYTVTPADSVNHALKVMRTRKVGRLPVTDSTGKLKGIISLNGILRNLRHGKEKAEFVYGGEENILSTLQSIAERNSRFNYANEFIEE